MVDAHDAALGRALAEVGYPPSVVERARAAYWSDFRTPLVTPKMDLVAMLRTDGHDDLAEHVIAGEFDG